MALEQGLVLLRRLLDSLSSAGLVEFELVPPSSVSSVDIGVVESALHTFAQGIVQFVNEKPLHLGQVQIKAASREVLEGRIQAFVHRKELEREAMLSYIEEGQCSRTVPFRYRRISVEQVNNEVGPQDLDKPFPVNVGREESSLLEDRLSTVEKHLGLSKLNQQTSSAGVSAVTRSNRNGASTVAPGISTGSGSTSGGSSFRRTSSESILEKPGKCPTCMRTTREEVNGNLKSLELLHRMKAIEDRLLYLESVSPEYGTMIQTT
ncbi:uncharacterized protein LOC111272385 isoform X2 [Varroa jacobsoni]|nr:uncharacterized protein LOC111254427 isoform X2 [Varroa destructor]XP_022671001.1 uncharacterized protein LOC111254427 isoform X2 [Varroa destructor]XP_022671002.1 uncharacterized protein LOC111254427 isoform X2 [Varroa destructor]XP_022709553.1 uncharacterized protein LOC111272385 isoform X2 [Varroa jacobsoni]XP_022709554.1 uncharacterized protein LOC111272385 isoform X2 [Varroa jacobsoni]XP_022709555.1 uncharacterized protein LOC111272385 isoform X2 [Varroa jacobsoni]